MPSQQARKQRQRLNAIPAAIALLVFSVFWMLHQSGFA